MTGDGVQLNDRLQAYIADHPEVDSERIYLTGVSLGGRGVLRLTLTNLRISALAVFCPAGGDLEYSDTDIERFRLVPIYFFSCPMDTIVPFRGTEALQQRIGARSSRLRVVNVDELAFQRASWRGAIRRRPWDHQRRLLPRRRINHLGADKYRIGPLGLSLRISSGRVHITAVVELAVQRRCEAVNAAIARIVVGRRWQSTPRRAL